LETSRELNGSWTDRAGEPTAPRHVAASRRGQTNGVSRLGSSLHQGAGATGHAGSNRKMSTAIKEFGTKASVYIGVDKTKSVCDHFQTQLV